MKAIMITVLSVAMLLMPTALVGQSTQPIKFITPFAFHAGDSSLPAGEYSLNVAASTGVLKIVSSDGNHSAFVNSTGIEKLDPETHFRLVFHCYATQYYLSEIWTPGFRTGRFVIPTGGEKEKTAEPQHVFIYAQLRSPER